MKIYRDFFSFLEKENVFWNQEQPDSPEKPGRIRNSLRAFHVYRKFKEPIDPIKAINNFRCKNDFILFRSQKL